MQPSRSKGGVCGGYNDQDDKNVVEVAFGSPGVDTVSNLIDCNPPNLRNIAEVTQNDVDQLKAIHFENEAEASQKLSPRLFEIWKALKACRLLDPKLTVGTPRRRNERGWHWKRSSDAPWSHEQCYTTHEGAGGGQRNARRDEVMKTPLTADTPTHRANLVKILILYFSNDGIGPAANNPFTSPEKKRSGMLRGLRATDFEVEVDTKLHRKQSVGAKEAVRLWKPVFKTLKDTEELEKAIRDGKFQGEQEYTFSHNFTDNQLKAMLKGVVSEMTVDEWVTTPWHYETLPYQEQSTTFAGQEGFSEGCKRCCRRFYEYPHHLYGDHNTAVGVRYYPNDLWDVKPNPKKLGRLAARPFHDPIFWSSDGTWEGVEREIVDGVYEFQRKFLQDRDKARNSMTNPMIFRRYFNQAYTDSKKDDQYYKDYPQGVMQTNSNAKVQFGDQEYRLSRSHKFGNLCRDCAFTLERAPGLLINNHKVVMGTDLVLQHYERVVIHCIPSCRWTLTLVARLDQCTG